MTTTIMGRCERTNLLGIGLATNTLASGGLRFYHIAPAGIVAHQSAGTRLRLGAGTSWARTIWRW